MKNLSLFILLVFTLSFAACSEPKPVGYVYGVPVNGTMYDLLEQLQYYSDMHPDDYLEPTVDRRYIWVMDDEGNQELIKLVLDEKTHKIVSFETTDHLTLENE